jgi:hypothetical protein
MNKLPRSRCADIVVQNLGKEVLIYDLMTHKAYNLNEMCAAVYMACNGRTSFEQLRKSSGLTDDIIFLALDELKKEELLESGEEYDSPFKTLSRREAIRRVGLASMIALPVISSLVAPTAAMAQSSGFAPGSRTLGQTCTASTQCASGAPNCTGGTCCVGSVGNNPSGFPQSFITNGTCPAAGRCNSLMGGTCCSGTASESSCTELVPGTIQVICVCN